MTYPLIAGVWLVAVLIVYFFLRSNHAFRISAELRNGISFLILHVPAALCIFKIDRAYKIFDQMPILVAGLIIGLSLVLVNTAIYWIIYRFRLNKKRERSQ